MKIEQFTVGMASQHTYSKETSRTETLRAWVGSQRPNFEGAGANDQSASNSAKVAISEAARQAIASAQLNGAITSENQTEEAAAVDTIDEETISDPKLRLLIRIVEAFTGRAIKLMSTDETNRLASSNTDLANAKPTHANGQDQPQGWGVEYDFHKEIHEVEKTSFTASGEILTADGKRLQFNFTLQMSREYHETNSVSFRAGDAVRKDPLVINFDGNATELRGKKFDFDIDSDGQADNISFVGSASGFLALDKNGNGRVDNGSELFGARTGDGFAELAAYDEDGNGWIDENDSVFAKLLIWTKDSGGTDRLSTLAERNLGALYLGNTATPFDLKDGQNNQHGQILSSGIYLKEDGGVGTIQQLDLFA